MTLRTWIAIRALLIYLIGNLTSRVLLTIIAIAVALILVLLSIWAYTEILWYDAIGYLEVLLTMFEVQFWMAVCPFVAMSAFVIVNMNIARRAAPFDRVISAGERRIDRWRRILAPVARPIITAIGLLCGLIIALAVFVHWDTYLLWSNGPEWGRDDPQFGRDLGYFMFRLPMYTLVHRWTFIGLLVTLVLTALTSYLFGGLRPQAPGAKIPFLVNLHLSGLMIGLMVLLGWGMVLELHLLSYSERGVITGLGFTDSNASLVAYKFVATAVVTGFILFQINIRKPGWIIPTVALIWLFLIGLSIARFYPNIYQLLIVEPQELEREYPFIEDHLAFTRYGFDLDRVERRAVRGTAELTSTDLETYRTSIERTRLWDPDTMTINFRELQALRTYFDFQTVDVDRYEVDGEKTLLLIGAREVALDRLPEDSKRWETARLIYSHGYGLAAASGTRFTPAGLPEFLVRDLPVQGLEAIRSVNPRIYYGERSPEHSIVTTSTVELDRPIDASSVSPPKRRPDTADKEDDCADARSNETTATTMDGGKEGTPAGCRPERVGFAFYDYSGTGGVMVDDLVRRLVFAIRFWDIRLALTWLLEDDTKVLFHREIRERVHRVAPYLKLDRNPYPVAVDGRIKWIVEGYTVSDMMPYSRRINLTDLTQVDEPKQDTGGLIPDEFVSKEASLSGTANYIRGSVKAVVDAYDGSVTLYVMDPDDKVLEAWRRVFPDTFTPLEEASAELKAHFRYPQDLFKIQSVMWGDYHMRTPEAYYTREAAWRIPPDTAFISLRRERKTADHERRRRSLRPYWLIARFPGEEENQFAIVQPFSPDKRNLLSGYLVGFSDGANYGRIVSYDFPPTTPVLGPAQAQARIDQDTRISAWMTLRMQSGSRVSRGQLVTLPIADTLLYVQPLFVQADKSSVSELLGADLSSLPELKKVVVVNGDRVVMRDTLKAALGAAVGEEASGAGPLRRQSSIKPSSTSSGEGATGFSSDRPVSTDPLHDQERR
ncbi:UPF0182 family protein [Jiella marina]|uniref:UPF0182 family protein n=1 Tax=Jiella sp. LLJ827 TaxID=2917712 RepID=UPI0021010796|nr:UPF0182 family protein [Jiella sp. LLJ827]MCQ0986481.1 UPF0182 family protein [Jiella sp. LLJ827]